MTSLFLLTIWLLTRLCFIRYDQSLPSQPNGALTNILIPQIRPLADEGFHQVDASRLLAHKC